MIKKILLFIVLLFSLVQARLLTKPSAEIQLTPYLWLDQPLLESKSTTINLGFVKRFDSYCTYDTVKDAADGSCRIDTTRYYKGIVKSKIREYSLETDGKYETKIYTAQLNHILSNKYYYGLNYRYDNGSDQHTGGLDLGLILHKYVDCSIGYVFSYLVDPDQYYHLLSVKLNFPFKKLTYRFHTRSAFTEDRMFEWWQQLEYRFNLGRWADLAVRYQLDHEFKATEREFEVVTIIKFY